MKKKVFYWSPCLNPVGTVISTINSSVALMKYSDSYDVSIINSCGEWDKFKDYFSKKNIKVIDLNRKYFKYLPKTGFIQSRFSYIVIFLSSLIPLLFLIKKEKPKFLIAHLITSLPIAIFKLFNFESELILRISGMPKLNFIRKFFWKLGSSKIKFITCPTLELKDKIKKYKIFDSNKIFHLPDAVINTVNFRKQVKLQNEFQNIFIKDVKVFLSAGRLTKQKNFKYLIEEFGKFYNDDNKNYRLVILGDGEELTNLKLLVQKKQLNNAVYLLGRVDNIFRYMKDADAFILSSKWEEMGFVIIESAFANLFIISSNCPNGPSEFLNYGENGILYENNKENALFESLVKFKNLSKDIKINDLLKIKKNSMKFSMFRHFKVLNKILLKV
tara:strand:- start:2524 stop:3684 length:1161 start_codon:yes stop_codon:yes gene_type:complete